MDINPLRTIPELFLDRVERTPDSEAFIHPTAKGWETETWLQIGERVRAVACGLRALGLEPEARCAILSGTRLEWILADLGVLCAGGATTTIYPGTGADECAYLLKDSDSRFVFAEDAKQLAKLVEKRAELPFVERVIILDGRHRHDHWVITLEELMDRGRELDARDHDAYERVARGVRSDALATLLYTSGTTGKPKGVELTHDCWVYESKAIEDMRILSKEDRHYLWLPLSHSFGKLIEVAQLRIGFSTAIDGNVDRMIENLAVIRPTFVCGVPRVFEKIHNRVVLAAGTGKMKERLVRGAFSLGVRVAHHRQDGEPVPTVLALEDAVADRLVFSKMRERFGGRLRFFISGSAPLSREVTEFFLAAKVLVLEGYGLTETSAASTGNVPQRFRLGSVGAPVPGTEIKIAEEDGEVLIRGRGVMRGYHNMPEATREVFTADGWLRTGDIGRLDADGFLFITDRKKDLIKTSTGKYVAPQEIEGKLKAICPLVGHVLVHGNNRNFVSALVTLDEDSVRAWARNTRDGASYAELTKDERVKASVQSCIDEMNVGLGNHQAIRKFAILTRDFSQDTGELTQSLKVKRKVIERENAELLDSFYGRV